MRFQGPLVRAGDSNFQYLAPNLPEIFFSLVLDGLLPFMFGFSYFMVLLKSAFSVYRGVACGNQCSQKRFPPQTGDFSPAQDGKRFCVSAWSHFNFAQGDTQEFSAGRETQMLRDNKQRNRGSPKVCHESTLLLVKTDLSQKVQM